MGEGKLNIATWNLCLGLVHKKNTVKNYVLEKNVDICCMQEVDIPINFPGDLMSFPGYKIEIENNNLKSRVATYIKNSIKYT